MKFYGEHDAVEAFVKHLDKNFLAIISPIKESDRGGAHAFATIEVDVE